ncbi:MAG TPA: tetratricopeptide repeat protein [Candidatus Acidoferrum sp.]|nr:tetratricopeptide repeat protein [Candidatus Acidoferrum sp.]
MKQLNHRYACLGLALLGLAALPATAQHEGHEAMVGWVPEELLERPLSLRQSIGTVHAKVSTGNPQAQTFYDQGLAYLHSFDWIEAARSFHQALRLDRQLAMAHLGLSDAYLGFSDFAAAHAALEQAEHLASTAAITDSERRKIQIRRLLFNWMDSGGNLQKYFAYRKAVTDAISATPDDPWLWIQRGFADEGTPQAHGQNGGADTLAFYQAAVAIVPNEFPAHHYLAHTYETLGRTQDALQQSEIYARMAPAIPHAHHMLGHDLRRAGRTAEAVSEFERAGQLEDTYYRTEKIPAQYDWHRVHNLSLLAMCYETLGQMKAAEKTLREAFALPVYVDLAAFNRREWPEFLLARGRTEEALAAAQELVGSPWAMGRFAGHTLAARALLRLDRIPEAQSEVALAERELEKVPVSVVNALPDAGLARAEILLRSGDTNQADKLFRAIVADVRSVPGPDSWSQALFQIESIASIARSSNDWKLAEFAAQQMIEHDPSYAGGYYALGLAAQHRGDTALQRQQFAHAAQLWQKADTDLPERARLTSGL